MSVVPIVYGLISFCDRRGIFVFPNIEALRWVGVAAYAAGETTRLAALHALGRQYSALLTIQPGHELIRTGPYRLVRHPFYLGQLLAVPGFMLALRSPVVVIVVLASLPFVISRIRREEEMLTVEFGDAYREYKRHSWRLLPGLF